MAGRLLYSTRMRGLAAMVVAMLGCVCTGCLVVDDIEARPEEEVPPNRPPVIDESTVRPSHYRTIKPMADKPGEGCTVTLEVGSVRDEDNQPLYARWFIDFDENADYFSYSTLPVPYAGLANRYDSTAMKREFDVARDFARAGEHVVYLVISDGFAEGDPPNRPERYANNPDADRGVTGVSWKIDTTLSDCYSGGAQ